MQFQFTSLNQEVEFLSALFVGLLGYALVILMIQRNMTRKSRIMTLLICAIVSWATAAILDPVFITLGMGMSSNNYLAEQALGTSLQFGADAIGNIFLIAFITNVFYTKKYKWEMIVLIVLQAVVLPVGFYLTIIGIDAILIYVLHLVCSIIIYIVLAHAALKVRRKLVRDGGEDNVGINGMVCIALSGIFLLAVLISFVLQEVATAVAIYNTPFISLGWILAGIACVFIYFGYVMPSWIRKRWEKGKPRLQTSAGRLDHTVPSSP
jgi:predicted neutral ceramidase superfamily lipid hydrolase